MGTAPNFEFHGNRQSETEGMYFPPTPGKPAVPPDQVTAIVSSGICFLGSLWKMSLLLSLNCAPPEHCLISPKAALPGVGVPRFPPPFRDWLQGWPGLGLHMPF